MSWTCECGWNNNTFDQECKGCGEPKVIAVREQINAKEYEAYQLLKNGQYGEAGQVFIELNEFHNQ